MDVTYEIVVQASDGYKKTTDSFTFNLNNIPPKMNLNQNLQKQFDDQVPKDKLHPARKIVFTLNEQTFVDSDPVTYKAEIRED